MHFNKMKKKKFILGASCILLTVAVVTGTVLSMTQTAIARASLPGVEKIVDANETGNPFVILEIVPDKSEASLGFFVAGEEPVDETGRSIKDMPSIDERIARFEQQNRTADDVIASLGISSAVSVSDYVEPVAEDEAEHTIDIRGVFTETESGDYAEVGYSLQYDEITIVKTDDEADHSIGKYSLSEVNDMELYRRFVAFRVPDKNAISQTSDYQIDLTALEDLESMPLHFTDTSLGEPVDGAYNQQYFAIRDTITRDNYEDISDEYIGELLFVEGSEGHLIYAGVLTATSEQLMLFEQLKNEPETETVSENDTGTVSENEPETETVSENEPETETEPETESEQEPESVPETVSGNEPESGGQEEETEEISYEEYTDVAVSGFTGKKMQRMSISLEDAGLNLQDGVEAYYVVKEADASDAGNELFVISDVKQTDAGDLAVYESYSYFPRPDGGFGDYVGQTLYRKNTDILPYEYREDSDGTHGFCADYTKDVYDTISYKGGFANEEWFKKYVFDLEKTQYADMCIDVIPVTLEELEEQPELLASADLIYFGATGDGSFVYDMSQIPQVREGDGNRLLYYSFDDENDGFTSDGMALTNNGAELVKKDEGNAIFLDGDDYLTLEGANSLLEGIRELTVSFSMKVEDGAGANWPFYVAPNDYTQNYPNERYVGLLEDAGQLKAERYHNNGSRPACAQAGVDKEVWTLITVVHSEDRTQLYVDGDLISTQKSEYLLADIFADAYNDAVFRIGKANWENGEYFNGWLDDFIVANYAMTQEEVETLSGKNNVFSKIMNRIQEGVPTVVNRSMYAGETNSLPYRKLAAALMQSSDSQVAGSSKIQDKALSALSLQDMAASMEEMATYVEGTLFVYDDIGKGEIVSGDFHNASFFNESEIESGFAAVLDEIENENFYLEVAGKEERIDEVVSMATAIRHIINFGDRRNVTKTSLRVLDLEPYDFEDYYPESEYVINGPTDDEHKHKTVYNDIKSIDADSDSAAIIETDSICITDGKLEKNRWIIENIAPQFEGDPNGLDVTIMGTKEFIGKLDDLNAEYDLIYLGLDTSIMNTKMEGSGDSRTKTDETVYNDSAMNGLVYAHVGDAYPIDSSRNGIDGNYRLAGNDITYDKLRELREYIEAGYAVILSDGFLKNEGSTLKVNTDKIDISSNMYKLINDTVLATDENGAYRYYGKNVNSKGNLESGAANVTSTREKFNRYLGISKLTLKYTDADLPMAYNQSNGSQKYLSADSDGIYRLYYNIGLENDAAVGASTTTYDCKLYVDIDADGRYENEEMLTGLSITDSAGNNYQPDGEGHYRLKAGDKYRIFREIPEGYTGFLAWKLVFEMNDRTYQGDDSKAVVRSDIIGYSAVPVRGSKPTIKVLQITTHPGTAGAIETTLDLNDDHMHTLYSAVQDFDIQINQIPASDYVSMSDTYFNGYDTYAEYLKQFDMLVMGFTDMYKYGSGIGSDHIGNPQGLLVTEQNVIDSMLAIREYALSGRSMMFTHDLNSMHVNPEIDRYWKDWGWYANQILRDIQGMDRFGVLESSELIPDEDKYKYESWYDEPYLEGKSVDNEGLSNPLVLNWDHKAKLVNKEASWDYDITADEVRSLYVYGETSRLASWNYKVYLNYQTNEEDHGYSSYVSQVNSGQITEYPYKIDETFEATHSHPQYLQLNMDTDSRDANNDDDIVVWYALDKIPGWCDSLFAANEMDVRNNFFIYNKGNITYTGSGDKLVTADKEMERKLFVNTLVASYRTGTHAARALFKENEWETSATITSTYLPYDPEMNSGMGGFLNKSLSVNFKTTNADLKKSDSPLYTKYYIDGTQSDYTIKVDGKYYKEIMPIKAYRLLVQNGTIVKSEENAAMLSNNSMHQVEFTYADLGLMADEESIRQKHTTNIYVRLGYEELEKGDISLSATESISGLNIVCTQLFELK